MAGVSGTLSWQDVKEWLEKQEPYLLQAVLKTTTNLLGTHCNNSEDMAASEDAKDDTLDDQEEKEKVEAEAREWEETANNGKKTESNKVALADVNETVLEEFKTQERDIFGGDTTFHKLVSESLKKGKVIEEIFVAQRMLYKHRR